MKKLIPLLAIPLFWMGIALIGQTRPRNTIADYENDIRNFRIVQRLTIVNVRTNTVIFRVEGTFRIEPDPNGLKIIGKNMVTNDWYLNRIALPEGVTWITEQLINYKVPNGYNVVYDTLTK